MTRSNRFAGSPVTWTGTTLALPTSSACAAPAGATRTVDAATASVAATVAIIRLSMGGLLRDTHRMTLIIVCGRRVRNRRAAVRLEGRRTGHPDRRVRANTPRSGPSPGRMPSCGGRPSRPLAASRADPAVIGVHVDIAAALDGDHVPAGEAVPILEDRRDAQSGRRFDDETGVVEEHPHSGDDRRLPDQDGVVGDQEEVVQDGRDGTPAGDTVGDGVGRVGGG